MRFTQAYAGNTLDVPSLASLMTGLHPGNARVRGADQIPLIPEDVTLAEVLRTAGYPSAAIGKWSLGWEGTTGHPRQQGFDEFFGFLEATDVWNHYPTRLWRNEEAFVLEKNLSGLQGDFAPDWFLRASTNSMRLWRGKPFFLYLATPLPHVPEHANLSLLQVPGSNAYADQSRPDWERLKAARLAHLDHSVGALVETLQTLLLDLDTLILFTSSTGPRREKVVEQEGSNNTGKMQGESGDFYEVNLRVPLIARWPGRIKPGTTNEHLVAAWDILPTLAEVARASRPKQMDGISFAPSLFGREQRRTHDFLYWELNGEVTQRAIRQGQWKGIWTSKRERLALYDLKNDPEEAKDVAEQYPERVEALESLMEEAVQPWIPPTLNAPTPLWQAPKVPATKPNKDSL
jgi:arylsulfatase A-like enzyme